MTPMNRPRNPGEIGKKRRICAVTGSRAEYGLLSWTLKAIQEHPDLQLDLVVTGSHLSSAHGLTIREIESDGLPISATVDLGLTDDDTQTIANALGRGISGIAEALHRLRPDLLLILGDRYETFAAAQAAMLRRIPVVHLHGGESTEGAMDEMIRHAITKLSHIHCVAAEPYARRVIQLGEQPQHVHVVGATALDAIAETLLMEKPELERFLGIRLGNPTFLITLHPETQSELSPLEQVTALLTALNSFPTSRIVFTGANADPGGGTIARSLKDFAETHSTRIAYHESLGQQRYLSLMKHADVVIGNSSSGIIEAPVMGKPVVNIGNRQLGRLRSPAIIDCTFDAPAISQAIEKALTPEHRAISASRQTPYGTPGAARRIIRILQETPLTGILQKRFCDHPRSARGLTPGQKLNASSNP